jgi:putative endonuclease
VALYDDKPAERHVVRRLRRAPVSARLEHREGVADGFTKRYGLKRLVYFERYDDIREARRREEAIKHWPRAWKVRLIHRDNPDWDDLYDRLL